MDNWQLSTIHSKLNNTLSP